MHSIIPFGHHEIGDVGHTDEDGHSHTTVCMDDATNAVGYCSLIGVTEEASLVYLVAVERVATGAVDSSKG